MFKSLNSLTSQFIFYIREIFQARKHMIDFRHNAFSKIIIRFTLISFIWIIIGCFIVGTTTEKLTEETGFDYIKLYLCRVMMPFIPAMAIVITAFNYSRLSYLGLYGTEYVAIINKQQKIYHITMLGFLFTAGQNTLYKGTHNLTFSKKTTFSGKKLPKKISELIGKRFYVLANKHKPEMNNLFNDKELQRFVLSEQRLKYFASRPPLH